MPCRRRAARSLRREAKIDLGDWREVEDRGPRFENGAPATSPALVCG